MNDASIYFITVTLTLNYINNSFQEFVISDIFFKLMVLPETIHSHLMANPIDKILIMQSANFTTYLIQVMNPFLGYISPTLSGRKILQFVNLYGSQYLLFNDSITLIFYNSKNFSVESGDSLTLSPAIY